MTGPALGASMITGPADGASIMTGPPPTYGKVKAKFVPSPEKNG